MQKQPHLRETPKLATAPDKPFPCPTSHRPNLEPAIPYPSDTLGDQLHYTEEVLRTERSRKTISSIYLYISIPKHLPHSNEEIRPTPPNPTKETKKTLQTHTPSQHHNHPTLQPSNPLTNNDPRKRPHTHTHLPSLPNHNHNHNHTPTLPIEHPHRRLQTHTLLLYL